MKYNTCNSEILVFFQLTDFLHWPTATCGNLFDLPLEIVMSDYQATAWNQSVMSVAVSIKWLYKEWIGVKRLGYRVS